VAPAALILSFTHLSTTLERLSGGRLFAPCSVSIQHCSAALLCVSGWDAGSVGGVSVGLVVQLARITAAISGSSPKQAIVELFIADRPEVSRRVTDKDTSDFRGYTEAHKMPERRPLPPPWSVDHSPNTRRRCSSRISSAMLVRDSRTSSANGACGRHERQDSAGMRLVTAASR
jgi:hypothetical protein